MTKYCPLLMGFWETTTKHYSKPNNPITLQHTHSYTMSMYI